MNLQSYVARVGDILRSRQDIVVENFRPGVMDKLSPADVEAIHQYVIKRAGVLDRPLYLTYEAGQEEEGDAHVARIEALGASKKT